MPSNIGEKLAEKKQITCCGMEGVVVHLRATNRFWLARSMLAPEWRHKYEIGPGKNNVHPFWRSLLRNEPYSTSQCAVSVGHCGQLQDTKLSAV